MVLIAPPFALRLARQVHVIQVREVRACNWDGTSDPRVSIEVRTVV
jgi:hypothetical protein